MLSVFRSALRKTFPCGILVLGFGCWIGCHQPGQAGPFELLTYEDVRKRAQQVAVVTQSRFMPPWLPEPVGAGFVGSRRLSVRDLGLLQQWVDDGALEGDPLDLPTAPQWTEGWQLGEPDLVVEMVEPYTLPADPGGMYFEIL